MGYPIKFVCSATKQTDPWDKRNTNDDALKWSIAEKCNTICPLIFQPSSRVAFEFILSNEIAAREEKENKKRKQANITTTSCH